MLTERDKYKGTHYILKKCNLESSETAKTIICITGIGGFTKLFDSLSDVIVTNGYNVLLYDLIGRGYSDYPSNNIFNAESHIQQLRDLIIFLGINQDKYILLGHSMGGCLASFYANEYNEEIASLILLSPTGLLHNDMLQMIQSCPLWLQSIIKYPANYLQELSWRLCFENSTSDIAEETVKSLIVVNDKNPKMFDALWECLLQFPLSNNEAQLKQLASKNIQTLLLWGEMDNVVTFEHLLLWKTILESDSLKTITYPDLGHNFFIEDPETVASDICEFLHHGWVILKKETNDTH
jgi:triacylglycerol lipase